MLSAITIADVITIARQIRSLKSRQINIMPSFQLQGKFSLKEEESRSHLSNDRRRSQRKGGMC